MIRLTMALLAAVACTGCTVSLAKDTRVAMDGISSVAIDNESPGVVYVVRNGKLERCLKKDGGTKLANCAEVQEQ